MRRLALVSLINLISPKQNCFHYSSVDYPLDRFVYLISRKGLDEVCKGKVAGNMLVDQFRNELLGIAVAHTAANIRAARVNSVKDVSGNLAVKLIRVLISVCLSGFCIIMDGKKLTFPTPTVTTLPSRAHELSNDLSVPGLPVVSIAPSIPLPPVRDLSAASRSGWSTALMTSVAPYFLARSRRDGTTSTAITLLGLDGCILRAIRAERPTAPAPVTTMTESCSGQRTLSMARSHVNLVR